MSRLRALFPYLARAWWGTAGTAGTTATAATAVNAANGATAANRAAAACALPLLQIGLFLLFLAWLTLPLLSAGIRAKGAGPTAERLLRFPLTTRQLALASMGIAMLNPCWLVLFAGSLLVLEPLSHAPHGAAGVAAGVLFVGVSVTISWLQGLLIAALTTLRRVRDASIAAASILLPALLFLGRAAPIGAASRSEDARRVLAGLSDATPAGWTARAAVAERPLVWLGAVAAALAIAAAAIPWSLSRTLTQPTAVGSRRSGHGGWLGRILRACARSRLVHFLFADDPATRRAPWWLRAPWHLPNPLEAAVGKERRFLWRTLDARLGLAIGVGGALWILLSKEPLACVLWAGIILIVLSEAAVPLNAFGLDRAAGVDRYHVLPIQGRDVILSKNLACFTVVLWQIIPLVAAAALWFGLPIGAAGLSAGVSYVLINASWGNFVSIRVPAARDFYNLDRNDQAGGVLSVLACIATGLVLVVASSATWHGRAGLILAAHAGGLALCLVIYRRSLPPAGWLFDQSADSMRGMLGS